MIMTMINNACAVCIINSHHMNTNGFLLLVVVTLFKGKLNLVKLQRKNEF